ncbi:hypothetical protein ACM46_14935 [Chryseobacterium angstadtii]|uniref:Uncharacterized protein n=1 Tax=Chryseobacterium angstadtii TaxID=558151 RepID=A0A0J7KW29_9FLAO|nr:hypothetical protein ACM46_14935 [Chryseobacterium angstadtii]
MEKINIRNLAILSFIIFLLNFSAFVFIDILEFIKPYSSFNKRISFFILFPLNVIGIIISFAVIIKNTINKGKIFYTLLCFPLLLILFYFFFLKGVYLK